MEENKVFSTPYMKRDRKQNKSETGIIDKRLESRKQFTEIKYNDPRERLKELPIKAAKERRQKNFKEKREERKITTENSEHREKTIINPNNKQLALMVRQLTEALKEYEMITRKEIDNIMEIVKAKFMKTEKEQEQIKKICKKMEEKLEEAKIVIKDSEKILDTNNNRRINDGIKDTFIHNPQRFKCGIAIMKMDENKLVKVPLIPRWKYSKHERKWKAEYWVQSMSEASRYTDFYRKNKVYIVKGRKNIITAIREYYAIKKRNMEEYRRKQSKNIETLIKEESI